MVKGNYAKHSDLKLFSQKFIGLIDLFLHRVSRFISFDGFLFAFLGLWLLILNFDDQFFVYFMITESISI